MNFQERRQKQAEAFEKEILRLLNNEKDMEATIFDISCAKMEITTKGITFVYVFDSNWIKLLITSSGFYQSKDDINFNRKNKITTKKAFEKPSLFIEIKTLATLLSERQGFIDEKEDTINFNRKKVEDIFKNKGYEVKYIFSKQGSSTNFSVQTDKYQYEVYLNNEKLSIQSKKTTSYLDNDWELEDNNEIKNIVDDNTLNDSDLVKKLEYGIFSLKTLLEDIKERIDLKK